MPNKKQLFLKYFCIFNFSILFCNSINADMHFSALEQFDLQKLKIHSLEHKNNCLWIVGILAPDNHIYTAVIGDFIGKKQGKITDAYSGPC